MVEKVAMSKLASALKNSPSEVSESMEFLGKIRTLLLSARTK
jgi:hypothetical protein